MKSPWLTVTLSLLLLGLVISAVVAQQQAREFAPLTSYSTHPDGGRALLLWLRDLGYTVRRMEQSPYRLDPGVGLVLVLEPSLGFEPAHVEELRRWVCEGGVLLVAGNDLPSRTLLQAFDMRLVPVAPAAEAGWPAQPLFGSLPLQEVVFEAPDVLSSHREDVVPWLRGGQGLLAMSVPIGEGWVVAFASPYPLTNAGLARGDNAALALYLASLTGPGEQIAIDEFHHGYIRRQHDSPLALALSSAWGWSLLYAGLVLGLYLALSGRRFGRPITLVHERRRNVGEYVRSMAALYRRARQRSFVAAHAAQHARRRLARDLGADPGLSPSALAEWLRLRGISGEQLARVLGRLEQAGGPSERELLTLVQESDRLLEAAAGARAGLHPEAPR